MAGEIARGLSGVADDGVAGASCRSRPARPAPSSPRSRPCPSRSRGPGATSRAPGRRRTSPRPSGSTGSRGSLPPAPAGRREARTAVRAASTSGAKPSSTKRRQPSRSTSTTTDLADVVDFPGLDLGGQPATRSRLLEGRADDPRSFTGRRLGGSGESACREHGAHHQAAETHAVDLRKAGQGRGTRFSAPVSAASQRARTRKYRCGRNVSSEATVRPAAVASQKVLAGDPMGERRTDRRLALVEVDVDDAPARSHDAPQPAEIRGAVGEVMVRVDDQHHVAGGPWQERVVRSREHGSDVGEPRRAQARGQQRQEPWLDVDREHAAVRAHRAGQAERSIRAPRRRRTRSGPASARARRRPGRASARPRVRRTRGGPRRRRGRRGCRGRRPGARAAGGGGALLGTDGGGRAGQNGQHDRRHRGGAYLRGAHTGLKLGSSSYALSNSSAACCFSDGTAAWARRSCTRCRPGRTSPRRRSGWRPRPPGSALGGGGTLAPEQGQAPRRSPSGWRWRSSRAGAPPPGPAFRERVRLEEKCGEHREILPCARGAGSWGSSCCHPWQCPGEAPVTPRILRPRAAG